MNIPTKKLLYIVTAMLAGVAFVASYSNGQATQGTKQTEVKSGKKGKKAAAAANAKIIPPAPGNALSAVRDLQVVKLNWTINSPGGTITEISVWRSATGRANARSKIAVLGIDATSYEDNLPNEHAHSYWVRLHMEGGKYQDIGPARAEADKRGTDEYNNPSDNYKVTITRTDDFATLKWDFPEDAYKEIRIVRATRPLAGPYKKKGPGGTTPVTISLEGKSQKIDALPDANSEYWYWIRITLKTGDIVYKGPIKAEYQRRSSQQNAK